MDIERLKEVADDDAFNIVLAIPIVVSKDIILIGPARVFNNEKDQKEYEKWLKHYKAEHKACFGSSTPCWKI